MSGPFGVIDDRLFGRLSTMVLRETGVRLGEQKRTMLESRLQKRVRALGLDDYHAYCDYIETPWGRASELHNFVDVVTTHKTDFFREPVHFDIVQSQFVPRFLETRRSGDVLRAWSAACSTGEEAYTLAMVLASCRGTNEALDFHIDATDVSERVVEVTRQAIYRAEDAERIPVYLLHRHVMRSKDPHSGLLRIAPELRRKVTAGVVNLISDDLSSRGMYHLIFCRNVLMYFTREDAERVIRRLVDRLHPEGMLFLGMSESLSVAGMPLERVSPSVYRRLP